MIKFFRKIRQNLLSEGKTGKYLKYAIGEIVLVVIGILIALQINTWNENLNDQKISNQTIELLKTEISEIKSDLDNQGALLKKWESVSDKYVKGKIELDSIKSNPFLVYQIVFVGEYKIDIPILERELTSDGLIIADEDFIKTLREIKSQVDVFNELSRRSYHYWEEYVRSYFLRKQIIIYMQPNMYQQEKDEAEIAFESVYNDKEFQNLVGYSNSLQSGRLIQLEQLTAILDEIIRDFK